ncbi:MAG: hypothetical protein M3P42_06885 [Actinomycetota bacterium]|nr:hypothetical protein [Actinomycetota bacterium]
MPDEPRDILDGFWVRSAVSAYYLLFLVLYGSMFVGFAFESRVAAFVVVGALVATLIVHIAVALLNYRHVMRREWPTVEPLDDDDDW